MSDTAGDTEFSAFVTARYAALARTAYLLTGSRPAAEDLVQTALAKTYASWHRIRDREAVEGYVRRVMVTTHTSWWRALRDRETPVPDPSMRSGAQAIGSDDEMDAAISTLSDRTEIWPHVLALPRSQRAVIVLRYYEQLSEAEIAAALGISAGAVKSHASRAMTTLRTRLSEARPAGLRSSRDNAGGAR
jgi:RNA polymerase sigma-70 factor (sigma-E family)